MSNICKAEAHGCPGAHLTCDLGEGHAGQHRGMISNAGTGDPEPHFWGEESKSKEVLLPLDVERCVTFKDRNIPYIFYFSRITEADWENCFNGQYLSSHNEGRQQVTVMDSTTPGIDLVENKLTRVEGYIGDFQSKPGWQHNIPPCHSLPAWRLLTAVGPSAVREERFNPEAFEAVLDAGWGMETPGAMTVYAGLVHVFKPLTAEQKRRFGRGTSEVRVVGDRKHGRTIFIPKQPLLLKLYNEMILEVRGYSVNGEKLVGRDAIVAHMDAYHKVMAAEQMFISNNEPDVEAEQEVKVA